MVAGFGAFHLTPLLDGLPMIVFHVRQPTPTSTIARTRSRSTRPTLDEQQLPISTIPVDIPVQNLDSAMAPVTFQLPLKALTYLTL
jgi:hypothetical protein